jgi:hypothetical protein
MSHPDFPSLNPRVASTEEVYVPDYVPLTGDNINLKDEVLSQYNQAKKMLHEATYDSSVPLNQKAQLLNSLSTIISTLIKQQQELFNLEQLRKIEGTLVTVLKNYPDVQTEFLAEYERVLSV